MLPAYNSFNGMTDGWGELLKALRALVHVREALLLAEQETIADLRQAAEDVIEAK